MGSTSDNEDEEHQEQMEAHGYAECIGREINKLQEGEEEWNNRTCIGRKGDDCGSPCNSSSAEFCDDCLAQEIGYCY